ncbi:hypothetical protein VN97_g11863, partial [Penicillium thymicola]
VGCISFRREVSVNELHTHTHTVPQFFRSAKIGLRSQNKQVFHLESRTHDTMQLSIISYFAVLTWAITRLPQKISGRVHIILSG